MDAEGIREYLADFQKRELPPLVRRELRAGAEGKIISVIGPRRAGKTFFLYQKMRELLERGVGKEHIVFLNFEDTRLFGIGFREVREIIKLHWQLYPTSARGKTHLFVDEPQNVERWENALRSLHDEGVGIFVTGSSSRLLSREIATSLRGRTLTHLLLPFSFREFLSLRGFCADLPRMGSKGRAELASLLSEYLQFGGFPEVAAAEGTENKRRMISEYFSLAVYRDLVERHRIRNSAAMKWLAKSLLSSFTREFSVHKTYNTLKSAGMKVSKNTLYSYLSAMEESLFCFFTQRCGASVRKRELSLSKTYLCDNGFAGLVESSPDLGKRMENAVFLELKRREGALDEIAYWKNPQQEEVDFVLLKGGRPVQLIQVCRDISNPDTRKREMRALLKASKELRCANLLVITSEREETVRAGRRKVAIVPLFKWLLAP